MITQLFTDFTVRGVASTCERGKHLRASISPPFNWQTPVFSYMDFGYFLCTFGIQQIEVTVLLCTWILFHCSICNLPTYIHMLATQQQSNSTSSWLLKLLTMLQLETTKLLSSSSSPARLHPLMGIGLPFFFGLGLYFY